MSERMADRLVAGIGFRRGATAGEIVGLVRRALAEAGRGELAALATAADRAGEAPFREAAAALGVAGRGADAEGLARADAGVVTRSARVAALRGVGSLAEAAALAVAGEGARLVLPRIQGPAATCALAAPAAGERAP